MDINKKMEIALEVIRVLKSRFNNFPEGSENNRNAPFHEAFLNAFKHKIGKHVDDLTYLISLSSWLQGLNTTLGQSFFENVAHILSLGQKRKLSGRITLRQQSIISDIMTDLKNRTRVPNLDEENELIFSFSNQEEECDAPENTFDNIVITDDYMEAIELKTVRPNAGEMRGEKQKILTSKAFLKKLYPEKGVRYFIGFPFDPFNDTPTGYVKERFMRSNIDLVKYLDPNEILLASELWDRLSEEPNTMEEILKIINNISNEDFMENFEFINEIENFVKEKEKYVKILQQWYLYNEIKIYEQFEKLRTVKEKIIHQPLFDDNGNYNDNRKTLLGI
jgi:hypothetical protein